MTSTPIKQYINLQRDRPSYILPSSPHARNLTRTRVTPNMRDDCHPEENLSFCEENDVQTDYQLARDWGNKDLVEPILNYRNTQSSKCLFPEQTEDGNHSQTLSKQIDNEILELRNFFEDHREEMISLLHGPGEDVGNHRSQQADCQNRSLSVLKQNNTQVC